MKPTLTFALELALFRHAFKSFVGALYPVMMLITIGRHQTDNLVAAAGARTAHGAGGKIDRLSDMEFVRPRTLMACRNRRGDDFSGCFLG